MTRVDRRLVAGEAERGGARRVRRSGDHLGRGGHLREAQARAHPVGHAEDRGVVGARRSEARGGGRSSAKGGRSAAVHGGVSGEALRPPGVTRSTVTRSVAGCGGQGDGGDMDGGERLRPWWGKGATTCGRLNGERGTWQEITVVPVASSAGSGEAGRQRGGEDDLRRPEMKTTAPRMKRSLPGLLCSVRRERGSRRSWEACRGGEGKPVAAATASGSGDGARVCEGESRGRGGG